MPPATLKQRMLDTSRIVWEAVKKYGLPYLLLIVAIVHQQRQVDKLDARTTSCQEAQIQMLTTVVEKNTTVMDRLLNKIEESEHQ